MVAALVELRKSRVFGMTHAVSLTNKPVADMLSYSDSPINQPFGFSSRQDTETELIIRLVRLANLLQTSLWFHLRGWLHW